MRIDKFLSNSGYGSRKEVKKLLKTGGVKVNDVTVKDAKAHVAENTDDVTVFGDKVEYKEFIYLLMNKPQGVISATEDKIHETVIDLLEEEDQFFEPFPVGRLDIDTEGLLIITNDGQLTHNLLSPKKHVAKTYYARIDGKVTEKDIEAFKNGLRLEDGYETLPAKLEIISSGEESEILVTIVEGKFHQVKRMFIAVDKKVVFLKRMSMGGLKLDEDLQCGEYRELTEEELELLFQKEVN